ncbi:MAG TPA: NifB/NifX family molybdenum-iron cluster-binding protein [Clostridiaceae bacterium]
MKIAIPVNGKMINQHFGRSENFVIVTVEDKKVVASEEVSAAEFAHQHKALADLLAQHGTDVVITGGIGAGAITGLQESGFKVIKGGSGEYLKAVEEFIEGTLEDKNVVCNHHGEHHHQHGEHHHH